MSCILEFTVKSLIYIIKTSKWFETNILTVKRFIKFGVKFNSLEYLKLVVKLNSAMSSPNRVPVFKQRAVLCQ